MRIQLKRLNDAVHFEAINEDGAVVHIDGSPEIGGENLGARPMQLLIMGLGGCSSIDVISILKKQKVNIEQFEVDIQAEREAGVVPSLFRKIHVEFKVKCDADLEKVEKAVRLSMDKYCSVSKTLEYTAQITSSVTLL